MSEQIEKDKIYNCDCLEDGVSPDNTGETTDGKGKEAKQLTLFGEEVARAQPKRPTGGSNNPIIFHDYESFVAKFAENPKTTDDTFTPRDVYEAVLQYVGEVYDLSDKVILRPFYPGGDYRNAEYPENGVVIDNPPFSIFSEIVKFYTVRQIPFFLFGQGKTIMCCVKYCTAVVVSDLLTYENGARIYTNFASNLFGDTIIMTAPRLNDLIFSCPSQNNKANLTSYNYPSELLSFSQMQTICRGGVEFAVSRNDCMIVKNLDLHPKSLFGEHLLLSSYKAKEKEESKTKAQEMARIRAERAGQSIDVGLSDRERKIIEKLDRKTLS